MILLNFLVTSVLISPLIGTAVDFLENAADKTLAIKHFSAIWQCR